MILFIIFIFFFSISSNGYAQMPGWVSGLPLMEWYSIPNTALSSVHPSPVPLGITGPRAKIDAWNGAALKRQGSIYMLGAAGGHADYAGNELNTLALNVTTPAWAQLRASTTNANIIDQGQFYLDLRPASTHTYYGSQFIDVLNRMIIVPSPGLSGPTTFPPMPAGWPYTYNDKAARSFSFNFTTGDWDSPDYVALYTGGGDFTAGLTVKHQLTGDIYMARNGSSGWWRLSPNNTWTLLSNVTETNYAGSCMDPLRNRILIHGAFNSATLPRVRDLNGTNLNVTFTGLGAKALQFGNNVGDEGAYSSCVYDEVNDRFIVIFNSNTGNIKIRRVHPTTWFVDEPVVTGTPPTNRVNGTLNAVQYVPELGGIVIAYDYFQNVKFMRLSTTASTLTPGSTISLTSLTLTSPTTQSNAPFSVGQVFKQGDIPSGSTIGSAEVTNFQATIKNAWPDGSARFAILSGRTDLVANVPKSISLSAISPPGGTALTEANLTATGITASIQVGATCTVNLTSLIGVASTLSAGRWTPGRVRTWVSGPQMSSWIYYSRCGSDPHLSVWFEVRLFAGGAVEVLPWVENATLNVAAPATKASQTIAFTLGGTQRFSQAFTLPHHSRYPLTSGGNFSHWFGTNPAVTPKHDTAYLQQTLMVPTYRAITPSTGSIWTRSVQTYQPQSTVNVPFSGMGAAGYAIHIGPLPEWDTLYLTSSGDPRALASVQANAYGAGHLDVNFRDELTNQPLRISSYPNLLVGGGEATAAGASTKETYTPTATPDRSGGWASSHHPSLGYMAYLLLGRFYFLEQLQFVSTIVYLQQTDSSTSRQGSLGILRTDVGGLVTRGAAWAIRNLVQAAITTPDGETLHTEFINQFQNNIDFYHTRHIAQTRNTLGFTDQYEVSGANNSAYSFMDDPYYGPWWMEDFFTYAWGFALSADALITSTHKSKLQAWFHHRAQSVVGRFGDGSPGTYFFADAAQFAAPVAPFNDSDWENTPGGPWFNNWGEVYVALQKGSSPTGHIIPCAQCVGPGSNLLRGLSGGTPDQMPFGYWGNLQPALAMSVTHGVAGAADGYNRMIGASNWATSAAGFNDNPIWSVMPSTIVPPTPPASKPMVFSVGTGKTFGVGAGKTFGVGTK